MMLNVCVCVCVCVLSHVQLFGILWTVASQASLFMGFSRQEYWSGLPFPFLCKQAFLLDAKMKIILGTTESILEYIERTQNFKEEMTIRIY